MRYQGPKYFYEPVFSCYERIKPFLSRKDVPNVLVGGIERISCSPTSIKIVGDGRLNNLMDKVFESLCGKNWEDKELEILDAWRQELYEEATIIHDERIAFYDPMLDLLVLSPDSLLHHMSASCVPMEHVIASNNSPYINEIIECLHYPYYLAGQFVFWNFGETKLHHDIQRYFRQLCFTYDKETDGKFSHESFINKINTGSFQHGDSRQKLVEAFENMDTNQISSFEETAAMLMAVEAMLPVPELVQCELELPSFEGIDQRLIKRIEKDPTTFLHYVKQKIDAAYIMNTPVFSLIETN